MYKIKPNHLKYRYFTLILILFTSLTSCSRVNNPSTDTPTPAQDTLLQEPISKTSFKLNTIITITLFDSTDASIIDECFALCDKYENLFSRTIKTSEIYKLNQSNKTFNDLSPETVELLQKSLYYGELSKGAFDITLEPITSLWNFGSEHQRLPSQEEISSALLSIGYQNVILNNNSVTLKKENMGIDLGAIAKGYIADQIKEYLLSRSVESAIINLGGNILLVGEKPNGEAFNIGIQKPYENYSETIAVMELSDVSVVSSGIYERYFVEDGKYYHHILNPTTGYPYQNDLISVTIISKQSADGDALSTTCFALGLEKGLELIDSLEDTYAAFITKDDQLHYSKGFLKNINLVE